MYDVIKLYRISDIMKERYSAVKSKVLKEYMRN